MDKSLVSHDPDLSSAQRYAQPGTRVPVGAADQDNGLPLPASLRPWEDGGTAHPGGQASGSAA